MQNSHFGSLGMLGITLYQWDVDVNQMRIIRSTYLSKIAVIKEKVNLFDTDYEMFCKMP